MDEREPRCNKRAQVTSSHSGSDPDDELSSESLLPLVYSELRRMAQAKMNRERPGHTLQATALVHEAYLRLAAYQAGDFSAAGGHANDLLELDPNQPRALEVLSEIRESEGLDEEAFQAGLRAHTLAGTDESDLASMREAFLSGGIQGFRAHENEVELKRVRMAQPENHGRS